MSVCVGELFVECVYYMCEYDGCFLIKSCCCSEVCGTLVGVYMLLIISEIN